jgi:hypothetical protein
MVRAWKKKRVPLLVQKRGAAANLTQVSELKNQYANKVAEDISITTESLGLIGPE